MLNICGVQLVGTSGGVTDWQNFVGVKTSGEARRAANAMEAPALASGYVTVSVRPVTKYLAGDDAAVPSDIWMAASYVEPPGATQRIGRTWDVRVSSDLGAATLSWDNTANLPNDYEAWILGGPAGPVNLRLASSMVLPRITGTEHLSMNLTLAVGVPEYVAALLAPAVSKDYSFIYPNPGPDAAGNMTFTYNLNVTSDVTIKIYDVGGKLVKELKGVGKAGGGNTVMWDTTNKNGQKVGSGVYIYILEAAGNKIIDKLAVVR